MKRPIQYVAAVLVFVALATPRLLAASRPNILVIVADDLGWGELGCQSFSRQIPTPNIDSIASNGVRFTSGYVAAPICSPSRAGFITGRYPQRFGHEFNPIPGKGTTANFGLSVQESTIGNRFKDAGYVTGWFGKSHLGFAPRFHPLQRGFDDFFGFLSSTHTYLAVANAQGRDPIVHGITPVTNLDYTTDAFGREAVNFIETHRAEPWLVYLAFNAVHVPLESTPKYLARFPGIEDTKRRTFAAMTSAMDDAVGEVLSKLRQDHLEENTLIFFFSDNGGPAKGTTSNNRPLRGFKGQLWEGGIRIPFMMQWKGHIPAGKVDDRPVISLDVLPTALAAAGKEIGPAWKLDGVNLLPYLTGEKSGQPHDTLFWRYGQQIAIRGGDWKLVKAPPWEILHVEGTGKASPAGAQLYNLARDLGEETDLAGQNPAKVKELSAAWDKWNTHNIDPSWPGTGGNRMNGKKGSMQKGAELNDDP